MIQKQLEMYRKRYTPERPQASHIKCLTCFLCLVPIIIIILIAIRY